MPYEILEKQIKALPARYYDSLVDYVNFLTEKAHESEEKKEEEALERIREVGLRTVWEQLKNDTW